MRNIAEPFGSLMASEPQKQKTKTINRKHNKQHAETSTKKTEHRLAQSWPLIIRTINNKQAEQTTKSEKTENEDNPQIEH